MRKQVITLVSLLTISTTLNAQQNESATIQLDKSQIRIETVLTEEERAAISPQQVIEI